MYVCASLVYKPSIHIPSSYLPVLTFPSSDPSSVCFTLGIFSLLAFPLQHITSAYLGVILVSYPSVLLHPYLRPRLLIPFGKHLFRYISHLVHTSVVTDVLAVYANSSSTSLTCPSCESYVLVSLFICHRPKFILSTSLSPTSDVLVD